MLGLWSGAPIISFLSVTFFFFPHRTLSPSQQKSWQIEHILYINEWEYTILNMHIHTSHSISIETWWLSLSVTCPIWPRLELPGELKWFRLYPHVWVSCGVVAQDKQKVCVSMKYTDQIMRTISRNTVNPHANAAGKKNFQVFLNGSALHVWKLRSLIQENTVARQQTT